MLLCAIDERRQLHRDPITSENVNFPPDSVYVTKHKMTLSWSAELVLDELVRICFSIFTIASNVCIWWVWVCMSLFVCKPHSVVAGIAQCAVSIRPCSSLSCSQYLCPSLRSTCISIGYGRIVRFMLSFKLRRSMNFKIAAYYLWVNAARLTLSVVLSPKWCRDTLLKSTYMQNIHWHTHTYRPSGRVRTLFPLCASTFSHLVQYTSSVQYSTAYTHNHELLYTISYKIQIGIGVYRTRRLQIHALVSQPVRDLQKCCACVVVICEYSQRNAFESFCCFCCSSTLRALASARSFLIALPLSVSVVLVLFLSSQVFFPFVRSIYCNSSFAVLLGICGTLWHLVWVTSALPFIIRALTLSRDFVLDWHDTKCYLTRIWSRIWVLFAHRPTINDEKQPNDKFDARNLRNGIYLHSNSSLHIRTTS